MKWKEAWDRARPMLEGVTRGRAPASEPGVELAYLDWGGDGDLIAMHHANGFCAATLAPIAASLRDRYRVVAFDARGHGDSTPVDATRNPSAYAWHRMAADYAAGLAHLVGTTGRDRVRLGIGHSFGGILSLAAAAAHPGLIDEMLLLDPVVIRPVAEGEEWTDRGPDLAVATRRRRAVFGSREEAFDHCAGRALFADFTPEALALYVGEGMAETETGEIRLKCDPEAEAAVFEQGRSVDTFSLVEDIDSRTRIVHAAAGNFSLELYAELAGRMPRAEVESIDCGHLFAMERPELVLERIEG